jgi:hypothetical protein
MLICPFNYSPGGGISIRMEALKLIEEGLPRCCKQGMARELHRSISMVP